MLLILSDGRVYLQQEAMGHLVGCVVDSQQTVIKTLVSLSFRKVSRDNLVNREVKSYVMCNSKSVYFASLDNLTARFF